MTSRALARHVEALGGQYAYLRRDLVRKGHLRKFWVERDYGAARTLPILALFCWGKMGHAVVRLSDLGDMCGLSPRRLPQALTALDCEGWVCANSSLSPGVVDFSLSSEVIARGGEAGFQFRGNLVAGGLWRGLTDTECALFLTVAALADPVVYDPELHDEADWLEDIGAVDEEDRAPYVDRTGRRREGVPCARRILHTTLHSLSEASGITYSQVSRALGKLTDRHGLLQRLQRETGSWLHVVQS